ncbi:MAG: flagellar type III secretion system pore protein FliP [Candidatus Eiseniibacteriota bacterium]
MNGGSLFGLIGAFSVTAGALALAIHLLKRMQSGGPRDARGVPLEVLKRVAVGPKLGVALLRVGERVLVVSIADSGTSVLAELSEDSARLTLQPSPVRIAPARGWPAQITAWLTAVLLVAMLPGVAGAQASAPTPAANSAPAKASTANTSTASTSTANAAHVPAILRPTLSPPTSPAPVNEPRAHATVPALPGPVVSMPLAPRVDIQLGEGRDAMRLSGTVGLVVFLGALTLLPAMFLLMTSFTRILIVLHFLRSALGLQTTPPGQLLVALAVLLTGVVMNPVLQQTNRDAIQPVMTGRITQAEAYQRAIVPFRAFMLSNTREKELGLFARLSGAANVRTAEELPTVTVVSAFVTSELRTAFQMGFLIYLPFVVVDVIVASVLMSLGMFMLPPAMVSLPFKLLLFVLADGWTLVIQNVVASFH